MAFVVGAAACGSDDAPDSSDVDPAAALTAIVEWQAGEQEPVVDDNGEIRLPVIYIASADGDTIDVGVQAEVDRVHRRHRNGAVHRRQGRRIRW